MTILVLHDFAVKYSDRAVCMQLNAKRGVTLLSQQAVREAATLYAPAPRSTGSGSLWGVA